MSRPLHLIVLAGGLGLRAGGPDDPPKQFRSTPRGPLFAVSLREFGQAGPTAPWHLASVTVTAAAAWHATVAEALAPYDLPGLIAEPGTTRTASTWQAVAALLAAVDPAADDLVAVHDAARPFASLELLDRLARQALATGGAVPGIPVPDTIVRTRAGVVTYLQRDQLAAVQTPQAFLWKPFLAAHRWAHEQGRDFTDDGGLLADRGHPPSVVPGEAGNWKVTTQADWERASELLR